ncbi:MAG: methionine biosynthesis protein MetW [Hyphomicrobiales bacterium]|nr:methionine biosynthesis protein MetW [Rickettsiales bacterium]MCP5361164.1 methionine biosynthesis protein MetW [Hyphomicrobiales bacterium]
MITRADLQEIAMLIPENARVLDIGCGNGQLMELLRQQKQADVRGIELDGTKVAGCVARGLSVVQGDAGGDLVHYPDGCFDVVVLAQTLQVMRMPREVLKECLRIGKRVIVSTPNFGHISNRLYLLLKGRMPVTSRLSYQWYETPNIHFSTLKDFIVLCEEMGCRVETRQYLCGEKVKPFGGYGGLSANLFGAVGIFSLCLYGGE